MNLISFKDHYVEMERNFDMTMNWIWYVNLLVSIGCFVAYMLIPGKELVFALYIPFDMFLNFCKTAFYWSYYYFDKVEKEEVEAMAELENKRNAPTDNVAGDEFVS